MNEKWIAYREIVLSEILNKYEHNSVVFKNIIYIYFDEFRHKRAEMLVERVSDHSIHRLLNIDIFLVFRSFLEL